MQRSALIAFLLAALALATPVTAVGATPTCNGKKATAPGSLFGTPGNDVIIGTSGNDTIDGLGGNDTICGLGGNDRITGGDDDDTLFGGDGDDILEFTFNAGNDIVDAGNGNDQMGNKIVPGDDTYDGGSGNDLSVDYTGKNVAHGGPGADRVDVRGRAYGDAGDDIDVIAGETTDGAKDAYASGGSGNDGNGSGCGNAVVASGGTADGGSGDDVVCIGSAGGIAKGGSGSDIVNGALFGGTSQLLDCGAGFDTYLANATDTVRRCEQNGNT